MFWLCARNIIIAGISMLQAFNRQGKSGLKINDRPLGAFCCRKQLRFAQEIEAVVLRTSRRETEMIFDIE